MNDDYSFFNERRRLLQGTGSLVTLGSLPAYLTANADELQATLDGLQQREGLVVYRDDEAHAAAFADILARAGLNCRPLGDDPVRHWRDTLAIEAGKPGFPVLGLTSWPDFLLMSDMAREKRKHVQLVMQHGVEQPGREKWPAILALDYLQLQGKAAAIEELARKHMNGQQYKTNTRTLFSWLIA